MPILQIVAVVLLLGLGVRAQAPREDGITPEVERAVQRGVAFLVSSQDADGSWGSGTRYGNYGATMTSLAGLALMAAGNTPNTGEYAASVNRAVDYLLSQAAADGLISTPSERNHAMYGHGFAMLFLAEAYGMEANKVRQQRIANVLARAVQLTGRAQSRDGGWYYRPNDTSDEGSVTVTQIQGLRACRNAGIHVPKQIIDRAVDYIQKCANEDGGISYSLRSRGSSRPAISAAATATLYNSGVYDAPVAQRCLAYTRRLLKENDRDPSRTYRGHSYYSILYVAQAMWLAGDEDWQFFFPKTRNFLLKEQRNNGAWMGDSVGEVYGTSIALLTLQLPYRQLPILQR